MAYFGSSSVWDFWVAAVVKWRAVSKCCTEVSTLNMILLSVVKLRTLKNLPGWGKETGGGHDVSTKLEIPATGKSNALNISLKYSKECVVYDHWVYLCNSRCLHVHFHQKAGFSNG